MSKIIVITGAGVGLGRALARRFASEGDQVVLLGRTFSKVNAAAAEIGGSALALACDVSSPDSVKAAFAEISERHPRIDVLVNNAALFAPFTVAEATDGQILHTIATNLGGPILCARSAIALMGRGGHIINVSSESVDLPFPHLILYQSTKAGLERFSLGLQKELESSGIRVTSVRAGQMMEEGKTWDVPPEDRMRFGKAAMEAGINLRDRPISQFTSVTNVFRALIDLPEDLHAAHITLHARKSG
ncbi:MAG: family oxidoreductase [Hydrocarboniphaga sp.]|uniref:SDR family oxidoreductase n=1 Tax=Hydrocarboniphaga sp. TaxID=2033016 RepID=UPI00260F6BFD|nr:SDR family oxidoreductase [Hydrocarboniphaga sp.]MDB5968637.1 family oxidoreductase [Hydrocarboniphaga sp.]